MLVSYVFLYQVKSATRFLHTVDRPKSYHNIYDFDAGAGVIVLLAQILKYQDGTQIATSRALRLQL